MVNTLTVCGKGKNGQDYRTWVHIHPAHKHCLYYSTRSHQGKKSNIGKQNAEVEEHHCFFDSCNGIQCV